VLLSKAGEIVKNFCYKISIKYPDTKINDFTIMPNHIHTIVEIYESRGEVTSPLPTLGKIVAYFKYQTTKQIKKVYNKPGTKIWQRNYYDHIIRDEKDLFAVRKYIQENPLKWELDLDNPNNLHKD